MSSRYVFFKQLANRCGLDIGDLIAIETELTARLTKKPRRQDIAEAAYKMADEEDDPKHEDG